MGESMSNTRQKGKIKYKAIVKIYDRERYYSLIECDHYTDGIW